MQFIKYFLVTKHGGERQLFNFSNGAFKSNCCALRVLIYIILILSFLFQFKSAFASLLAFPVM